MLNCMFWETHFQYTDHTYIVQMQQNMDAHTCRTNPLQSCFDRQQDWVLEMRMCVKDWACSLWMKLWNAHMEHVIEWEMVSRWIETVFWHSNKSMRSVQPFCCLHSVCSTFIWLAPLSSPSLSSRCQSMHNIMNLCCSIRCKKYKSNLIKNGKDLFPGVSETSWLAEWLAVALLLLLSLSSVTFLLPKWTSVVLLVSEFYHNHTATHKPVFSAWLPNPHPDTSAAILTNINHRLLRGMSQCHTDENPHDMCSSWMQTKINDNEHTTQAWHGQIDLQSIATEK